MRMLKPKFFLVFLFLLEFLNVQAQELQSPNGKFVMYFGLLNDGTPTYQLTYLNKEIIKKSKLGLELQNDSKSLLNDFTVVKTTPSTAHH